MTDSEIAVLLRGSLPVLKGKITALQDQPANAIRSYERIVRHLETLLPAIGKQFGGSTVAFTPPPSDAWWASPIADTGIFLELEKRYFADEAQRQTSTGDHRSDVVLTLHHNDRKLRILLEYKTTSWNATLAPDALSDAFSQQLIPYLNYEVAAEIQSQPDARDDFICCIAVHLREEERTGDQAGDDMLEVAPDLAYSLKRNPVPPAGKPADANQHCFFVFDRWPNQEDPASFTDWLLQQIGMLGKVADGAPAQPSSPGEPAKASVVHVVFGPPGSGKSTWVSENRPHAKVFAPPSLSNKYAALPAPPLEPVPKSLVIEEWQHFEKSIFGAAYGEAMEALGGEWDDLTVLADFGQARKDNYHFTAPYDDIHSFIKQHAKRSPSIRFVPLWIPLRQVHLGIAFMLWIEAIRRELRNADKKGNFYLAPAAAAQGFVNARQLLINRRLRDEELFDIRIVRSADLVVSDQGVSVAGGAPIEVVLQLQPTQAEKMAAFRKEKAAQGAADAEAKPENKVLSALKPLTVHPVDVAGLEFNSILVRMENQVSTHSNQLNEILLACTRARRRLWILVDDNWRGDIAAADATMQYLHEQYELIGLGALRLHASR